MNWINSSTELYCSFAKTAGNTGCQMMNTAFYYYGLNKVYKSFSVDDIESAVSAVKTLDIKGFAITMPYKIDILPFLDTLSDEVSEIGACNTVLNKDGVLIGYNTDSFAAMKFLGKTNFNGPPMSPNPKKEKRLFIIGDGGYSKAVQYAAYQLRLAYNVITREAWNDIPGIKNSVIYNCTPVDLALDIDNSNIFINCLTSSKTGTELANMQASKQFELYTNEQWPFGLG